LSRASLFFATEGGTHEVGNPTREFYSDDSNHPIRAGRDVFLTAYTQVRPTQRWVKTRRLCILALYSIKDSQNLQEGVGIYLFHLCQT